MARKILWLFVFASVFYTLMADSVQAAPAVTAKAAIVMDATTGEVLYAKDAESRRYPASTTKMMTLLVALEKGRLDDWIVASKAAHETEGSSLYLETGEKQKLLDLLYGIMLVSGNDATVAVAEHIAGSVPAYAQLMTQKALEIGAVNTHFANSSGLPDPNHYSTAHDLARIAAYGYRTQPLFAEIVSSKRRVMPWPGKGYDREIFNENRMLWLYPGSNGVKTGYTDAAGRCLVSAAKRNGLQLISVVLDSERMWDDSIALLDYGFGVVKAKNLLLQNQKVADVAVLDGLEKQISLYVAQDIVVPESRNGAGNTYRIAVQKPDTIAAPVHRGDVVGTVRILRGEEEVTTIPLLAGQDVERRSLFRLAALSAEDVWTWVKVAFARLLSEGRQA